MTLGIVPDARDMIATARPPHEWIIEVCAVCGCQLGPGIGSRTRTGRCVVEAHRSAGGVVVHVQALPDGMQELTSLRTLQTLRAAGVAVAGGA